MITLDSKPSETVKTFKSRGFQPIIYSNLSTSTLMNHQRVKRIKGLLGYSEQFKESCKAHEPPGVIIKPFKSRDYRMTRELNLEIFEVDSRIKLLEKLLKVQRNLRNIRIKIMSFHGYIRDPTKPLCEAFGKISRINRIQIDFGPRIELWRKESRHEKVKATRKLPSLKELAITQYNEELEVISMPLLKVGFDYYYKEGLSVKDHLTIEKLMKKTCKFDKLDTIQFNSEREYIEPYEALAFAISKLPNLREISIELPRDRWWDPTEQILKIFDALLKTSNIEILRLKMPAMMENLESIIAHPVFKAKSLKRVHLCFISNSEGAKVIEIMQLLKDIPMLYELSLYLTEGQGQEEITRRIIEEIAKMNNLRKLELQLSQLSEKQARDILRSLYKMSLLEELSLYFSTCKVDSRNNSPALSLENEIQELPRLQKVKLMLREYDSSSDRIILGMAEFFGKCYRLREMMFDVEDCRVASWEDLSRKLLESWRKLKHLQILQLNLRTKVEGNFGMIAMPVFVNWMRFFERMESLQDLFISKWYLENEDEREVNENLLIEGLTNPKYRFFKIYSL